MSKTHETVEQPALEKPALEEPEFEKSQSRPDPQRDQQDERKDQVPERVYLVPYPKVVFLYPTFLVGLLAAIWMSLHEFALKDDMTVEEWSALKTPVVLGAIFLTTMAVNLIVLTLDFPRATSLTLFFIAATVFLGVMLVAILRPDVLPFLTGLVTNVRPIANATFYWVITGVIGLIFILVKIKIQFDYWEVRRNELLHHHGVLSDLRRYPTQGLQISKEISDVFEYCLLRSGCLTLKPQGEDRVFVLENVPKIGDKEAKITQMLSAMKVKVQVGD